MQWIRGRVFWGLYFECKIVVIVAFKEVSFCIFDSYWTSREYTFMQEIRSQGVFFEDGMIASLAR